MKHQEDKPAQIGESLKRADGFGKVTGTEKYAADLYPDNLVIGGVVRSPYPHARIRAIEFSSAAQVSGVIAVITHEHISGTNRVGLPERDQPILADDKVRYIGDPVVLVLAENKQVLREAMSLVQVEYEILPPVFDSDSALQEGAPVLHEGRDGGNLLFQADIKKGDIETGFSESAFILEETFYTPYQEHAYLETEVGVGRLTEDGILEITVSTQTPFRDGREVADALGFPQEKVRVIAPYLGGAFGGKDGITVQGLLGIGALYSGGRPVKIYTSREESFISSTKRHPAKVTIKMGCLPDGTLHALYCSLLFDTGAYAGLGTPVLIHGMNHASGVYRITHTEITGKAVYTNNPVSSAFRAFGIPQVIFGLEQVVDMLAQKAGIDPLTFRMMNAVHKGDYNGLGIFMSQSTGISSCLATLADHPLWKERDSWIESAPPFRKRGVGIAANSSGMGYGPVIPDTAGAKIEILPDGRFRIYGGIVDMGQGNSSTSIHIASSILMQPPDRFELIQPDTHRCLPSGSASASRTTYTFGNALITAAEELKVRIFKKAGELYPHFNTDTLTLEPDRVLHTPDNSCVPLQEILLRMSESERTVTSTWTAPTNNQTFDIPGMVRILGFPNLIYSYAAHLARVEVNELTGQVTIDSYLACTDAGNIINPQVFEQQVQGAIAQGIGYALYEDFIVREGQVITKNFSTYILPTSLDIPDIISHAVSGYEETGPFGLKGMGELGVATPLPCIANAIANCTGCRLHQSPLTPERILTAVKERRC